MKLDVPAGWERTIDEANNGVRYTNRDFVILIERITLPDVSLKAIMDLQLRLIRTGSAVIQGQKLKLSKSNYVNIVMNEPEYFTLRDYKGGYLKGVYDVKKGDKTMINASERLYILHINDSFFLISFASPTKIFPTYYDMIHHIVASIEAP